MDFHNNYKDCCMDLPGTLWNLDPREFYHNYQAISKYFNGNSDNFRSLNFCPVFLQWEGKYMNNQWNWTIGWVYGIFKIFPGFTQSRYPSQGTQAMLTHETKKVWTLQPKPSHARGAEHEEQLEEQHRQGAAVQPYPVIT